LHKHVIRVRVGCTKVYASVAQICTYNNSFATIKHSATKVPTELRGGVPARPATPTATGSERATTLSY